MALAKLASRGPAFLLDRISAGCSAATPGSRASPAASARRGCGAREAALAPGQVEVPQAAEALVVAELLRARRPGPEALAPAPQRAGVVRGDVLELELRRSVARGQRCAAIASTEGRQPPGKTNVLAKLLRRLLGLVGGSSAT